MPTAPRYRFFGGKGGVGKTTCAAAAALAAAANGRRVLVVSTDPAHSLGDALGRRISATPRRIPSAGALWAVELDADRALARWMGARKTTFALIAARGTYLDEEDIDRFLKLSLPGVDELMGLLELGRVAEAQRYDDVIVDTAPTGHTLRLLETPEMLRRLASVLDDMHAKHRFLAESLGGAYRRDIADALIEEIDTHGRALADMLRDRRRCSFSWVVLPERLALEEAIDGVRALEKADIAVNEIVVNRVTHAPDRPCALCDARVRVEHEVIDDVRETFSGHALRFLPDEETEPRGMAALHRIGRQFMRPQSQALAVPRRGRRASLPPREDEGPVEDWLPVIAPPDIRLLLFGGKGGVGKSTCAAATALALAGRNRNRRFLLLSTDPAHSLGDVFGATIGDDEKPLADGLPNLFLRELDADRAWMLRRDRFRKAVDEVFATMLKGRALDPTFDRAVVRQLIDLAPPGLDELFGVLTVVDALFRRTDPFHTVVVDTAPTGHALRLLRMPASALEWVRALLAIILKYRSVIGLGDFAADLVEISRDLRHLQTLLGTPAETRFVTVTRLNALPRLESRRLLGELQRLGIDSPVMVVNAVRQPGCARCVRAARREKRELSLLVRGTARQRREPGVILAPLVAPPPRGVVPLERWSRRWTVRSKP